MSYPRSMTEPIQERSGGLCERCGAVGHSYHHRKLRSRGGEHTAVNCVWLCGDGTRGCHGWCHANPREATATGWMVPSWLEPDIVPAVPLWAQR